MIVLDTSVLLYAIGGDHDLREPCAAILSAQLGAGVQAATTVEVIQEFTHARSRRNGRDDAVSRAQRLMVLLDLLVTTPDDLLEGLRLFRSTPRIGAFDAMLAAVAITRNAEALVSADKRFATVPDLRVLDPVAAVREFVHS